VDRRWRRRRVGLCGGLFRWCAGSQQYRVLVVSGEDFNAFDGAYPWAVVIRRTGVPVGDYVIPLEPAGPLTGAIVEVPRVMRCDPTGLWAILGYVSPFTVAHCLLTVRTSSSMDTAVLAIPGRCQRGITREMTTTAVPCLGMPCRVTGRRGP
jgi:hypothetical protein